MMRWTLLVAPILVAAGPMAHPDWPCQQPLVARLTAATFWSGPAPTQDWKHDAAIAALAAKAADRSTPIDQAVSAVQDFAKSHPDPEPRAELFAGLVDQSNEARDAAVDRIEEVNRELRVLAAKIGEVTSQVNALPADAPADQRDEITDRRALMIRQYNSINRTVRYACEIPVDFEQRLGRFARVLQPD